MRNRRTDARKKAKRDGKKRYFSGLPCKNGHVADRYTSSGFCCTCAVSEKHKAARKEYYTQNIEVLKEKRIAYKAQDHIRQRLRIYKWKRFGIDDEAIQAALASPSSTCQICGSDAQLVLDHCHATGGFRGWLCHKCNLAIGNLDDSELRALKVAEYLSNFKLRQD